MSKGYHARKTGKRTAVSVLIIVCEGTKTEPLYFNRFRQRNSGLKIETLNSGNTDPLGLVQFALRVVKKYDLDKGKDQVWCVFDVDKHSNEVLAKAKKLAAGKVHIALSNPSFELWYLLHYQYSDSAQSTSGLISSLETQLGRYDKAKEYFDQLSDKTHVAVRNSKRLNQKHISAGVDLFSRQSNPSTKVCDLVEYIQNFINTNNQDQSR